MAQDGNFWFPTVQITRFGAVPVLSSAWDCRRRERCPCRCIQRSCSHFEQLGGTSPELQRVHARFPVPATIPRDPSSIPAVRLVLSWSLLPAQTQPELCWQLSAALPGSRCTSPCKGIEKQLLYFIVLHSQPDSCILRDAVNSTTSQINSTTSQMNSTASQMSPTTPQMNFTTPQLSFTAPQTHTAGDVQKVTPTLPEGLPTRHQYCKGSFWKGNRVAILILFPVFLMGKHGGEHLGVSRNTKGNQKQGGVQQPQGLCLQ